MTTEEEKTARRQAKQYELTQRIAADIANLERDTPIRERFHAYLASEGFHRIETPSPGRCYNGSHAQMLWECWLAAVLTERADKAAP